MLLVSVVVAFVGNLLAAAQGTDCSWYATWNVIVGATTIILDLLAIVLFLVIITFVPREVH